MKNKFKAKGFTGAHKISIIGLKGLPPEFTGTSGVEFYVSQKIPALLHQGVFVRCYVRGWATPKGTTHHLGAQLVQTPSIRAGFLDAVTHSFTSTVHACFSSADIVWYHATGSMLFSFLPRLFGKKVFVTIHTLEWKRIKWGPIAKCVLRISEWIGVKNSSECFVVSDGLSKYVQSTYGKAARVDEPQDVRHKKTPPTILRQKYSIKGNDYILYVGRFVSEKRIEWLIRAYKRLHPTNMRLIIAGGQTYGRSYEAGLHSAAKGDKNIVFAGWVFGAEKQALLDNCALFALPSSVEGNPMVFRELPRDTHILVSDVIANELKQRANVHVYAEDDEEDFFSNLRAWSLGYTKQTPVA